VDQVRGRIRRDDTCTGAYVSKRLLNATPEEAILWAAAVTSLKLEERGPFRQTIDQVRVLIREEYSGGDSAR
jgi:sugar/nucleoside kinase (ribokinase family)